MHDARVAARAVFDQLDDRIVGQSFELLAQVFHRHLGIGQAAVDHARDVSCQRAQFAFVDLGYALLFRKPDRGMVKCVD